MVISAGPGSLLLHLCSCGRHCYPDLLRGTYTDHDSAAPHFLEFSALQRWIIHTASRSSMPHHKKLTYSCSHQVVTAEELHAAAACPQLTRPQSP